MAVEIQATAVTGCKAKELAKLAKPALARLKNFGVILNSNVLLAFTRFARLDRLIPSN